MTDIPEMKKWALVDLSSAKQEFDAYCESYNKLLSKAKSEMDILGLKMQLSIIRQYIDDRHRALR